MKIRGTAQPIYHMFCSQVFFLETITIPVVGAKNHNVDVSILDVRPHVMSIYLRFDHKSMTIYPHTRPLGLRYVSSFPFASPVCRRVFHFVKISYLIKKLRDKLRDDLLHTGKSFQHTCARTLGANTCESTAPSVRVSALLMATGTSQRQAPVVVQVKMDVTITADAGNRRRSMARK